jgi:hypothetical protein
MERLALNCRLRNPFQYVLVDRGERAQAEALRDLLKARTVPLLLQEARDEIDDLSLAAREYHGRWSPVHG